MALNRTSNVTVYIQSGNNYIGEGDVEVTIVDDDCKCTSKLGIYK